MTNLFQTIDKLTLEQKQQLLDYIQQSKQQIENTTPFQLIPGLHAHLTGFWMSDDFDDKLPDSFWFGEDEV